MSWKPGVSRIERASRRRYRSIVSCRNSHIQKEVYIYKNGLQRFHMAPPCLSLFRRASLSSMISSYTLQGSLQYERMKQKVSFPLPYQYSLSSKSPVLYSVRYQTHSRYIELQVASLSPTDNNGGFRVIAKLAWCGVRYAQVHSGSTVPTNQGHILEYGS